MVSAVSVLVALGRRVLVVVSEVRWLSPHEQGWRHAYIRAGKILWGLFEGVFAEIGGAQSLLKMR